MYAPHTTIFDGRANRSTTLFEALFNDSCPNFANKNGAISHPLLNEELEYVKTQHGHVSQFHALQATIWEGRTNLSYMMMCHSKSQDDDIMMTCHSTSRCVHASRVSYICSPNEFHPLFLLPKSSFGMDKLYSPVLDSWVD
jgi:hypothetical protein